MDNQVFFAEYAFSWLGVPYIWGGQSRMGVDCSGLVQLLLQPMGRDPRGDQTAQTLFHHFWDSDLRFNPKAEFGDLAFYGPSFEQIKHVGFCLNYDLMIEAKGGGRNTSKPMPGASVELSPILSRGDFLGVLYTGGRQ